MNNNNENYTLTMVTCICDLAYGTIEIDKKEVKNCYIYKNSDNYKDIWLATKDEYPAVEPIIITDSGEKIYFLKNWLLIEDSLIWFEKETKLKIVIYYNNVVNKNDWITFNENLFSSLTLFSSNLEKIKTELINKINK